MSPAQADLLGVDDRSPAVLIYGRSTRATRSTPRCCARARRRAPTSASVAVVGSRRPRRHARPGRAPSSCSASSPTRVNAERHRRHADADWAAPNLPPDVSCSYAGIPIRASCHNADRRRPAGALTEVAAAGLAVGDRRRQHQHLRRLLQPALQPRSAAASASLCRHAWGRRSTRTPSPTRRAACRRWTADVVRIFRKHNFAWGGNFLHARRHALRVGRRAPRPAAVPVEVLPEPRRGTARIEAGPVDGRPTPARPTSVSPTTARRCSSTTAVARGRVTARPVASAAVATRFVIIGGGPAGNTAATYAARLGAEVTLIERDVIGGAAHLWDCIPSKTMIATGGAMSFTRRIARHGPRAAGRRGRRRRRSPSGSTTIKGRLQRSTTPPAREPGRRA